MDRLLSERLELALTVRAIMTPSEELFTVSENQDLDIACQEASRRDFDLIPIMRENRIIGVVTRDSSSVKELTNDWVISNDTEVSDVPSCFLESEKPGLFVLYGRDIVGLVTPADLNKIPMRMHVYRIIGHLEYELAKYISEQLSHNEDQILGGLNSENRNKIHSRHESLQSGNASIGIIQVLDFSDMINILQAHNELRKGLGYDSRSQAKDLGRLVHLRNSTMHTVRPLIADVTEDVKRLNERIDTARELLKNLENMNIPR